MEHSRTRRWRNAALALAAGTALLAAGCGGSSGDGSGTSSTATDAGTSADGVGDTLTLIASPAPSSLDPVKSNNDPTSLWFSELAYEPLIRMGLDGELSPGIAESWRYVGDGNRRFELAIRQGLRFADGTPITTRAVADTIRYWRNEGINGEAWGGPIERVTAVDDRIVRLDFSSPYPVASDILTDVRVAGSVISPSGLENPRALGSDTFGAGPYRLDRDRTVTNDHYTYVPNPEYWDRDRVHWRRVVIRVIADPNSALQTVQSGQADLMLGNPSSIPTARSAGLNLAQAPSAFQGVVLADREGALVPELRDQRVRQALNYAIDREAIADALYPDAGTPTDQTSAPSFSDFDAALDERYPYDPARARELLAEAGLEDGFSFVLSTPTTFGLPQLIQAMASQWAEVGVRASVRTVPVVGTWFEQVTGRRDPAYAMHYNYIPAYFRAQSFYMPNPQIWNAFATRDAELSRLVEDASATVDADAQAELWRQAGARFVDLGWAVPVVSADSVFVASPRIAGVEVDAATLSPKATEIRPAG